MKTLKPTLLALICGLLLTVTHQQLRGVIADNQTAYEQRLLREMAGAGTLIPAAEGWEIHQDGETAGKLVPVSTDRGYNGRISLLVAYTKTGEVINVRVSQHRETPGIGDGLELIVSDWILGFNGRHKEKEPSIMTLDGMTGATITSDAVKSAISEAME